MEAPSKLSSPLAEKLCMYVRRCCASPSKDYKKKVKIWKEEEEKYGRRVVVKIIFSLGFESDKSV